jgi:hypothetical protein
MTTYRVTIKGQSSRRIDAAFEGWRVSTTEGLTELVGDVRDQSELFGVLEQIRDLGIELLRICQVGQVAS